MQNKLLHAIKSEVVIKLI